MARAVLSADRLMRHLIHRARSYLFRRTTQHQFGARLAELGRKILFFWRGLVFGRVFGVPTAPLDGSIGRFEVITRSSELLFEMLRGLKEVDATEGG